MKRVVVEQFGGPEVLRVVEVGDPRPGPGEVRVRVLGVEGAPLVSFPEVRYGNRLRDRASPRLVGLG